MQTTGSETARKMPLWTAAIHSPQYIEVRRRIFRQLVESLIYEKVVRPSVETVKEGLLFQLHGKDGDGRPVIYRCTGKRRYSFDRIRLTGTVERVSGADVREADSFSRFLLELREEMGADEERLKGFIRELEETHLKDAIAQFVRHRDQRSVQGRDYDALEGEIMDGHTYHPSYKSRIGFDPEEHTIYGPEFRRPIAPVWVAVSRRWVKITSSRQVDPMELIREQAGEVCLSEWLKRIREQGKSPEDMMILPVHPWQWQKVIAVYFQEDIRQGDLIYLGETADRYLPQQSIRTLANGTRPELPYLKLSLSILNTSTGRVLAPHTVQNAALVTDWLQGIVQRDAFLREEMKLSLLGEVMGVSYDPPTPGPLHDRTYGVLGCIWRESLHRYLEPGEEAVPFNGVCSLDRDGTPLIDAWVKVYGVENWTKRLLDVSVTPIIHLLYAHGIGMESHAQNMVLIHEKGWPRRVALKDFHDGIRFSRKHLTHPEQCPDLIPTPEAHARVNRNSFIETDDPKQVADFMHDAFFFINLTELAMFLQDHYGYLEERFWDRVREVIRAYQARFSHLEERFQLFDLFAPVIDVEQLTKRRLFPETEIRVHPVHNALANRNGERGDASC
ncbi:siderophore biosynthesis protein IucA [Marinithermofilum abyssi]|uniref:Siderophore biosynthesis protein IucA n=1 Tax=Marinithermofilum abyssi TaxID=1571185 RepID=A0A8J2Y8N3_9BACL|nr:IucA/IucC family protein [Marinithermofilum abyssi]GGE06513.1 siderophore biosynthesis protein IucA [Marinithermofilum abyssi]